MFFIQLFDISTFFDIFTAIYFLDYLFYTIITLRSYVEYIYIFKLLGLYFTFL